MHQEMSAFIKRWNNDHSGLHQFCGQAMASSPQFLNQCFLSFATELIQFYDIGKRIDFIYATNKISKTTHDAPKVVFVDKIACVCDASGDFGNMELMLLRNIDNLDKTYSIRMFCSKKKIPDYLRTHWKAEHKPTFKKVCGKVKSSQQASVIDKKIDSCLYDHALDHDDIFWTFCFKDKCLPRNNSLGFLDPLTTRRMVLLITRVTNLTGYKNYGNKI